MADWMSIALFIGIGLALLMVELFFVPGTTLVGIGGLILTFVGLVIVFESYGTWTGLGITAATLAIGTVGVIYGLRSGVWDRFSNLSILEGRTNELDALKLKVGDEGTAVSYLRPSGSADFGGEHYEVHTLGEMAPAGTRLRVITIENYKITVEVLKG